MFQNRTVKSWNKEKNRGGNTGGFTLVELIVTLTLLVLLLAGSAAGILAYTRYANFKRNNEYARTFYNAAQAALTHAKANGTLEELQEEIAGVSGEVPSSVAGGQTGKIRFLMKDKASNGMGNDSAGVLRRLLAPYITDASVFEAAVCLEADFKEGLVTGVCYCDLADGFSYSGGSGRTVNIAEREESVRRKAALGFYGDDLSGTTPPSEDNADISEMTLVNDETLHLRWVLEDHAQSAVQQLSYVVQLFQKGEPQDRLTAEFFLDTPSNPIATEEYGGSVFRDIEVVRYQYQADGSRTEEKIRCDFQAYLEGEDYSVNLVLDAVDLALTSGLDAEEAAAETEVTDTYSITRFGLDPFARVYARVQASGGGFQDGEWKQSNEEQPMFALDDAKPEGVQPEGQLCRIENARHLFNACLVEKDADGKRYYRQTASFAWGGEDGILDHKKVFYQGSPVAYESDGSIPAFPGFTLLHAESTYQAEEGTQIDALAFAPDTKGHEPGTGFVRVNRGTVEGLTLDTVEVRGLSKNRENGAEADYAGAVCGQNYGIVKEVRVLGGSVSGRQYVGGVIGLCAVDAEGGSTQAALDGFYSGADVTGYAYVGGVLGEGRQTVLKNCQNTGLVSVCEEETTAVSRDGAPAYSSYFGGIAGSVYQSKLQDCVYGGERQQSAAEAAPERTRAEAAGRLCGSYVGGIAGLNAGSVLQGCSVKKEYLAGEYFVGGFTGIYAGLAGDQSGRPFEQDGAGAENQAAVFAKGFAGGITGANLMSYTGTEAVPGLSMRAGELFSEASAAQIRDLLADLGRAVERLGGSLSDGQSVQAEDQGKLKNWKNSGYVTAQEGCAGGIAGYNNGWIEDCTSELDTTEASREAYEAFLREVNGGGAYAGGVTGVNNGILSSTDGRSFTGLVDGGSYVGGLIGLNDTEGEIRNCHVGNSVISGAAFVGGVAGLNRSARLYDPSAWNQGRMKVQASGITGESFVGGIAGVNLLCQDADAAVLAETVAGNTEGILEAKKACVGGIWGYDQIVTDRAEMLVRETELLQISEQSVDLQAFSDALRSAPAGEAKRLVQISGSSQDGTAEYPIAWKEIRAQLYAGGVLGYHKGTTAEGIQMKLTGVICNTPVTAAAAVRAEHAQDEEREWTYSFAGGLTGWITEDMWAERCRNEASDRLKQAGTFHGALAEVNEGRLEECTASDFGVADWDYVGGLTGLNGVDGEICGSFGSGTVQGRDCVGGLAAENKGWISGQGQAAEEAAELLLSVSGRNQVGGVAGCNEEDGRIEAVTYAGETAGSGVQTGGITGTNTGSIQDVEMSGAVAGGQAELGGIAGTNAGSIQDAVMSGAVKGNGTELGGIAGANTGEISGAILRGTVSGEGTNVGGIAGSNSGTVLAVFSENPGESDTAAGAAVQGRGNVGGIIGQQESGETNTALVGFRNEAAVTAAAGDAGGILGAVKGEAGILLTDCQNDGVVTANGKDARAAGILVYNTQTGSVQSCTNRAQVSAPSGMAGGIAAVNRGEISDVTVQTGEGGAVLVSGGSLAGGIAARSEGEIVGRESWMDEGLHATVTGGIAAGGAAGINSGQVKQMKLIGSVQADGAAGGIVGRNEAGGSLRSVANEGLVSAEAAGGIIGKNESAGGISAASNTGAVSGKTNAGGIIGWNRSAGAVSEVSNAGAVTGTNAGGVIGRNEMSGSISAVSNQGSIAGTNAGGVAGLNESAGTVSSAVNEAKISGVNAGGIFGANTAQAELAGCVNRGSIEGARASGSELLTYVGGMVGKWGQRGGVLRDCENYGQIRAASAGRGAGILGGLDRITKGAAVLNITECRNYGYVDQQNGAGILGASGGGQNVAKAVLNDCINTGYVHSGAGIVLDSEGTSYELNRCRNFGWCDLDADKSLEEGGTFCGIVRGENALPSDHTEVNLCFGAAGVTYPIAYTAKTDVLNYYFGKGETKPSDIFAKIKVEPENIRMDIENVVDGNPNTVWSSKSVTENGTSGKEVSEYVITITLDNPEIIKSVEFLYSISAANVGAIRVECMIAEDDNGEFSNAGDGTLEASKGSLRTNKISLWKEVAAKKIKLHVHGNEGMTSNLLKHFLIAEMTINGHPIFTGGTSGGGTTGGGSDTSDTTLAGRGIGNYVDPDTKMSGALELLERTVDASELSRYDYSSLQTGISRYKSLKEVLDGIWKRLLAGTVHEPLARLFTQEGSRLHLVWENNTDAYIRNTLVTLTAYRDAACTDLLETAEAAVDGGDGRAELGEAFYSLPKIWYGSYVRAEMRSNGYGQESQTVRFDTVLQIYEPLAAPEIALRLRPDGSYDAIWQNAKDREDETTPLYTGDSRLRLTLGEMASFDLLREDGPRTISQEQLPSTLEEAEVTAVVSALDENGREVQSDRIAADATNLAPLFDTGAQAASVAFEMSQASGSVTLAGKGYPVVYRAELLLEKEITAGEETVTIPVVADQETAALTAEMSEPIQVMLQADLAEGASGILRAYPWHSENGIYSYSWYTARDLSAEELLALFNKEEILTDGTLRSGFYVECSKDSNGAERYHVGYSPLLDDTGRYAGKGLVAEQEFRFAAEETTVETADQNAQEFLEESESETEQVTEEEAVILAEETEEPDDEPMPEAEWELELELSTETESETESESESDLEIELELGFETESETEQLTETERESEAEQHTETEAESETELYIETEAESETEQFIETESESEFDPEIELELGFETETEPESEREQLTTSIFRQKTEIDTYTVIEGETFLETKEQELLHRSIEWPFAERTDGFLMRVYRLKNQKSDEEMPEVFQLLLYRDPQTGVYRLSYPPSFKQIEQALRKKEQGIQTELKPRQEALTENKKLLGREQKRNPEISQIYTLELDGERFGNYYVYQQLYREEQPEQQSLLNLYSELQVLEHRDGSVTVRFVLPDLEPESEKNTFCSRPYRMTQSVVVSRLSAKEETDGTADWSLEEAYDAGSRVQWLRLTDRDTKAKSEWIRPLAPEDQERKLDDKTAERYAMMKTASPEIDLEQMLQEELAVRPVADKELTLDLELDLSGEPGEKDALQPQEPADWPGDEIELIGEDELAELFAEELPDGEFFGEELVIE